MISLFGKKRLWSQSVSLQWFSSVSQSCLTLCTPMWCSMPGLPVPHQRPELAQTHVHQSVMPSNNLILCHPLLLLCSIFPSIRSFPMSQFFTPGGQSIEMIAPPLNKLVLMKNVFCGYTLAHRKTLICESENCICVCDLINIQSELPLKSPTALQRNHEAYPKASFTGA